MNPASRGSGPWIRSRPTRTWWSGSAPTGGAGRSQEIANDPRVTLYYPSPEADGYVSVYGTARLVDDPAEKASRWKEEWTQFYPDREASYLLIEVVPARIEVVSYRRGIVGDPDTWTPASIEFPDPTRDAPRSN